MNIEFISWLEQQNYSILGKWDGDYRRALILYTTKKRMKKKGKWRGPKIAKYKWSEILNKNLWIG